ncbi:hypothetical protein BZA05DRAFT_331284 [Tricharina praecox]|uniref:uncharacterized protein n=1 Tax=Tricharina praecox TaxID=43433 RepID=UPI00221E53E2|nr:uncharacterized protein BZA05DRAFT_331284 [Tricharina praecox]KAI5857643.1 hypothetical protein BZA05DRAFT_331284 [Tricharina praecox]
MSGGNIKVVVRVRPFNSREKERGAKLIVQMKGTQTVLVPPPGSEKAGKGGGAKDQGPKVFNFDKSYWSFSKNDSTYAGQNDLYQDLGEPLLDNAFGGYNNCIFAYGQTGSGKSYSMMGYGEEHGVIPKICQYMFERINALQTDPHLKCTVEVSYLEIYNERVRDLLNPSTKAGLKVREHPSTGPYVEDLAKLVVGTFAEIENLMDEGNKARTVAATNMNETSSRSHAKVSRISLVDLAGSERATSTGATGARLKEGAEINRSLSTLGRVIAALADVSTGKTAKKKATQVPYRDSVLTWLLKDSLGGNSMTAMIAAISPADINFDETLSTLRYADSAKRIKNHAVVNEDPNARMIRELKEELQHLRSKLSTGTGVDDEVYAPDTPPEKQMILTDLNQTWEERLEKTQQVHKERESALEELGISIERGFIGLSTPKKMPHLVNLSDDPLLAECLVYNIKPGTTQVGNLETSTTAQIRLNGSKILQDHCRFENDNGIVTLVPNEGAAVMVNGLRIEKPRRLRTGFRIILGDFHIFRFNHPQEARAERDRLRQSAAANSASLPQSPEHKHTPREVEERLRLIKEEMQGQLEQQKEEYQEKLKAAGGMEVKEIEIEKQKMQEQLDSARAEMQKELERQRQEFENRLEEITLSPKKADPEKKLTDRETSLAKFVIEHWKQRRYVRMAESILQHAATLKEAQIMSQEMEKMVVFQFTIVDEGHTLQSSYDLVLNGVSGDDDEFLEMTKKPCVGVRVMDFHAGVVHLWSLEKLQNRVRQMRQIYQYLDRPEYLQHFRLGDPFTEPILPQYSLVGDVDVPLAAIFESRSQDFALDITSPHTQSVVGIVKLTIEPSEVETRSTLKFNVIMRDMIGFAEREGTQVHAQMFIPGVSDESGATTTTMVSDFDEGPIRFDSVHTMGMPLGGPLRNASLRVAIFAKITAMHLEKLISWDDMRDHSNPVAPRKKSARLNETEFYTEERHDVFARVQLLELSESGEYLPVEVVQHTEIDSGAFQLHQGLQRRLQLSLTHSSGEALQWRDVADIRIGSVRLLDPRGKMPDLSSPTKEVRLSTILGPVVKTNADGTSTVTIVAQWDSSLHNSILLDRTTADKYRVQMCLRWNVVSERLSEPILFSLDIAAQIQPRLLRSPNMFMQLWNNNRIVHASVGLYQLVIRPAAARRAGDLWRMNTLHRYVKGEEYLAGWTPRSVSLVRDFISAKKRRTRVAEVENAKGFLRSLPVTRNVTPTAREPTPEQHPIRVVGRVLGNKENGKILGERKDEPIAPPSPPAELLLSTNEAGEYVEAPPGIPPHDAAYQPETPASVPEVPLEEREPPTVQSEDQPTDLPDDQPEDQQTGSGAQPDDPQMEVLRKFVGLWSSWKDPSESILVKENTEPPHNGACFASTESQPPRLIAEVRQVPKSTSLLKYGYLMTPDETNKVWTKRYFELRRPYMHVHSFPDGEEIMAINLSHCRIDHQPQVARLMRRPHIFAIYAPLNTYLFAARSEREMIEWIMKVDQFHFFSSSRSNTPEEFA